MVSHLIHLEYVISHNRPVTDFHNGGTPLVFQNNVWLKLAATKPPEDTHLKFTRFKSCSKSQALGYVPDLFD